jgi:hypothetical protein
MSKKLRSSLYVALVGAVLLLLQSAPASAQVQSEFVATLPSGTKIPLGKKDTVTTVFNESLTAPASGCPCEAFVSYFLPIQAGSTTGGLVESEVVDESNPSVPLGVTEQQVPAGANRGIQRADLDPFTVPNGQSVDFQLLVEPAAGGMTVEARSVLFVAPAEISIFFVSSAFTS